MPDDFGNVMMKEWLKQRELLIDDINPVDRLTYVGKRGMGAFMEKFIGCSKIYGIVGSIRAV